MCAFLVGLLAQPGRAQDKPETPPYLLRLERILRDNNVCALIRADGHFHLEKQREVTRVFEGTIPQVDVASLQNHLNSDRVSRLSQAQIRRPPLILRKPDELLVSIHRAGGWQDLVFPTAESRDDYRDALDPLLKLLEELQKAPQTELSEDEDRNNCLLPGKIELKTRAPARPTSTPAPLDPVEPGVALPGAVPTGTDARKKDLSLVAELTTFDGETLDVSCFAIYTSGRFHHESKSQKTSGKTVAVLIREGSVALPEMEQLTAILNDPALMSNTPEEIPTRRARQFEIAKLVVARDNGMQQIVFWSYAARSLRFGGLPDFRDHGMKLVRPLRKWLKVNVEEKPATLLPETSADECGMKP